MPKLVQLKDKDGYIYPVIKDTGKIIWQNSNDGNAFAGQNINSDLTKYKWFKVLYKLATNQGIYSVVEIPFKNTLVRSGMQYWSSVANADVSANRNVNFTDSQIQFGDCTAYGIGNYTYTNTAMSSMMIPSRIIGYEYDWNK